MARDLKKGNKVQWNTSQGKTRGIVEKKQVSETRIEGHKVVATKTEPQCIVKSLKSGKRAAHKPAALQKKS